MMDLQDKHVPPWRDGAQTETSSIARFGADLVARVNPIPRTIGAELAARGLVGIEASPASARLLDAALSWIARLPELVSIVHAIVRDIHLLEAGPGYDVSHSEPRWRSSIFVSVPDREDEIGALRLAESIVHEAMHLHLTNREQQKRFVAPGGGTMRSPWRDELRPYQGVLHGLYVFSCLSCFFRSLLAEGALGAVGRAHAAQRSREIAEEVRSIDFVAFAEGLTGTGIALAEQCRHVATNRLAKPASVKDGF